jgi:hypothetical protein
MFKAATPFSLFSVIVFRKYVLIRLNVENDLSAVLVETGRVANTEKLMYVWE